MGKSKNKQLAPLQVAVHLLDQANTIHTLEKFCNTIHSDITRIVDSFNKANMELAKRIQVLESRVEDLEKFKTTDQLVGARFTEEM